MNTTIKISKKQLEANKRNALKGGVKTQEGKENIKYNAVKHGLSSSIYNEVLEEELIKEYNVNGILEKILIKNTCIAKSRYEKGVELEHHLMQHIINPPRYEKNYKSQIEYKDYLIEKKETDELLNLDLMAPMEPDYTMKVVDGNIFEYDKDEIEYLINVIGKYNYQNEVRLNKNILSLLQVVKS